MAVRRVLDNPDEEVVHIYGDGGSDVDIRGLSADVKTTCAEVFLPDLIVSAEKELKADLYVLCHRLAPDRIRVVGFASQEMVTNRQPKRSDSREYCEVYTDAKGIVEKICGSQAESDEWETYRSSARCLLNKFDS